MIKAVRLTDSNTVFGAKSEEKNTEKMDRKYYQTLCVQGLRKKWIRL